MTETARFFDLASYTEADQAEVQTRFRRDGVLTDGPSGMLAVTTPGGMVARVAPGEAMVQGFWYKNDANIDFTLAANSSGSNRFDYIVLRLNRTANTLTAVVIQGTPGAGTPGLTQVAGGNWDFPLALMLITDGATSPSVNTDARLHSASLPVLPIVTTEPTRHKMLVADSVTKLIQWAEVAPVGENLLDNPALQINQKNDATGPKTVDGARVTDRWKTSVVGAAFEFNQAGTPPPSLSVGYYLHIPAGGLRMLCTSTSITNSHRYGVEQRIEGYRWSKAWQQPLVLSWWSYATKAGVFAVSIRNAGGDRSFVQAYTHSPALAYQFNWITIPPSPSTGTWDLAGGIGAFVGWWSFVGTAVGSGHSSAPGTWQNGNYFAPNSVSNILGAVNDALYIFAPKLEVGTVPTRFSAKSAAEELLIARRYFEHISNGGSGIAWGSGWTVSTNQVDAFWKFNVMKRSFPTSISGGGTFTYDTGGGFGGLSFGAARSNGLEGCTVRLNFAGTFGGIAYPFHIGFDSAGYNYLEADADL